jgi:hypothetical protein
MSTPALPPELFAHHIIPRVADQWLWGVIARARLRRASRLHRDLDLSFAMPPAVAEGYRDAYYPRPGYLRDPISPEYERTKIAHAAFIGWDIFGPDCRCICDVGGRPRLLLGIESQAYPIESAPWLSLRFFVDGIYLGFCITGDSSNRTNETADVRPPLYDARVVGYAEPFDEMAARWLCRIIAQLPRLKARQAIVPAELRAARIDEVEGQMSVMTMGDFPL